MNMIIYELTSGQDRTNSHYCKENMYKLADDPMTTTTDWIDDACNLFEYRSFGNHSKYYETTFEHRHENVVLKKKGLLRIQYSLYFLKDNTSNKSKPLIFYIFN